MITLLRFVGSKQVLSFEFPSLSLPSTSTKIFLHGVASWTGFRTPTFNILLVSCLIASYRCTGISQQEVCFGVAFESNWIWYRVPGKHPIPSGSSGYLCKSFSLLVTSLEITCCWFNTVDSCFELWADTFCLELLNRHSRHGLLWVVTWTGNQGSSWWQII